MRMFFNKLKFKKLLEKAIGDKTITQFAKESEVNRTYLSKYINEKLDNPPTPDIIRKIADNTNKVSYEELMMAAGHISMQSFLKNHFIDVFDYLENEIVKKIEKTDPERIQKLRDIVSEMTASYEGASEKEKYKIVDHFLKNENGEDNFGKEKLINIPVIGTIRAGKPLLAEEHILGFRPISRENVSGGTYFYLKVKGDSMTGSRIYEGDYVLVRRQADIESGEIAVVMVNKEEATLKRVYKKNHSLILQPDNSNYEPLVLNHGDVRIIGKVVKVEFDV